MLSFITGSRAYGKVQPNSDIDLVIRTNTETAAILRRLADKPKDGKSKAVRFGRLNLIICETDEQFAVWRLGTTQLKREVEPVDREDAKVRFDILRAMAGICDEGDSGDV
jgi:predicted nucleotidyltransferase